MKPFFLLTLILLSCNTQPNQIKTIATPTETLSTPQVYNLILPTDTIPGRINIPQLTEPIRAMAAFYAAMGGTLCTSDSCQLTTALGLGKQGSPTHQYLIKKYFPNDKVAKAVLDRDCVLPQSGANSFTDFAYLTITHLGDTVQVDYNLMYYNRGNSEFIKGPDTYLFKDNTFKKLKRNLWQFIDK